MNSIESRNNTSLRRLLLIVMLSSAGGVSSALVSRAAKLLAVIPLPYPLAGQFLSGLHVVWLILAAFLVKSKGSALMTGTLKGLVEVFFSQSNVFVFLLSFTEGFVVEAVMGSLGRTRAISIYLAGGLSSASNLLIVGIFFLPPFPVFVYLVLFLVSFLSGILFGGYLTNKIIKIIRNNTLLG